MLKADFMEVRLRKSAMETSAMIQNVFESKNLCKAAVLRCRKSLKDGRQNVEDKPHAGRTSLSRNEDNV